MNETGSGMGDGAGADAKLWGEVDEASELLHEERWHDALVELRRVLGESPKNPYAFHLLGVCLYECGELGPSRDAYRACLALAPGHLGARVALCHVLRKLGEHRPALVEGMRALEQAPGDADALHAVGLAYLAKGDGKAARRYLEAFLGANPEFEVRVEVEAVLDRLAQEGL